MTSKYLELREHSSHGGVELTHEQMVALASLRVKEASRHPDSSGRVFDISPESKPGHFTIRPNSIVGSVKVGDLLVNISPKAGTGKTVYMLAHALDMAHWMPQYSEFEEAESLVDALVPVFLQQVSRLVSGGLAEKYVLTEEVGSRPRGRFKFDDMVRRPLPTPASYEFDDLTSDTPPNRYLLAALSRISGVAAISPRFRSEAKRLTGAFAQVNWVPHEHIVMGDPSAEPPRYRLALAMAWLILHDAGVESARGSLLGQSLLFDMNRVFEAYIESVLADSVPAAHHFDPQARNRPLFLDTTKTYRLKPDLAYWRGPRCILIGDIKYKVLDRDHGPRRPDLYQVATYASSTRSPAALLVYAGPSGERRIRLVGSNQRIDLYAVDLDRHLPEVEQELCDFVRLLITEGRLPAAPTPVTAAF